MSVNRHIPGEGGGVRNTVDATPHRFPLDREAWSHAVAALHLSPQQARIVELLLEGKRDKQIAATMGLGLPTVRTYLGRVFAHLRVADRVELILHVLAVGREVDAQRHQS